MTLKFYTWIVHKINLHLRFNWDLNLIEVCAIQSRSIKCIMSDLKWLWSNMKYETLWFTIDRYITVYIKVRIQLFWNPIADKETYNISWAYSINRSSGAIPLKDAIYKGYHMVRVFNSTFNNISVLYCGNQFLIGVRTHQPADSHWQTLSHNVVSCTPRLSGSNL